MLQRKPRATARRSAETNRRATRSDGLPSSEHVYRGLKDLIIGGELPPGSRLVELDLAARFGVSRTPVREALKRIAAEHLVEADAMRGLVVRTPEAAEVEEVYLVREVLDGLAVRLATERVTSDELARLRLINETMREGIRAGHTDVIVNANIAFHDAIYRIAGNQTLARHGRELRNFVRRFSSEAFVSPTRVDAVLRDHQRVLEAMERRDPVAAERAASEHLRTARAYVAQLHLRKAVGAEETRS